MSNDPVSLGITDITFIDQTAERGALEIMLPGNVLVVRLGYDGDVKFGPGFTADEASREMWRWLAGPLNECRKAAIEECARVAETTLEWRHRHDDPSTLIAASIRALKS